jgi:hypothetical protein
MENKYFTPDIEDFCIGYEYETIYLKSVWTKESLRIIDACWFFESYQNDAVPTEFRVPYLTKEQIEAEGWIKAKAPIVTINHDFYEIPYIKDNFRVDYNFRNNLINIIENNGKNLFYGKCKDINTFRKIIKLLGI